MQRQRFGVLALMLGALVAAGCGGDRPAMPTVDGATAPPPASKPAPAPAKKFGKGAAPASGTGLQR
ncbi:MAG TPA: hypothetical protein VF590_07070 [Isosphaeraceae bacterium]